MTRILQTLLLMAALGFMSAPSVPADSIDSTSDTVWGSGMIYVPPADLTGWFFNSDAPPAFPVAPDPSQPWTSAANIATLDYWLGVATDLGNDPATLDQLYTAGMIGAPTVQALDIQTQAEDPPEAAEPAAFTLLGAGLLAMCITAIVRTRRMRRYP